MSWLKIILARSVSTPLPNLESMDLPRQPLLDLTSSPERNMRILPQLVPLCQCPMCLRRSMRSPTLMMIISCPSFSMMDHSRPISSCQRPIKKHLMSLRRSMMRTIHTHLSFSPFKDLAECKNSSQPEPND